MGHLFVFTNVDTVMLCTPRIFVMAYKKLFYSRTFVFFLLPLSNNTFLSKTVFVTCSSQIAFKCCHIGVKYHKHLITQIQPI